MIALAFSSATNPVAPATNHARFWLKTSTNSFEGWPDVRIHRQKDASREQDLLHDGRSGLCPFRGPDAPSRRMVKLIRRFRRTNAELVPPEGAALPTLRDTPHRNGFLLFHAKDSCGMNLYRFSARTPKRDAP